MHGAKIERKDQMNLITRVSMISEIDRIVCQASFRGAIQTMVIEDSLDPLVRFLQSPLECNGIDCSLDRPPSFVVMDVDDMPLAGHLLHTILHAP